MKRIIIDEKKLPDFNEQFSGMLGAAPPGGYSTEQVLIAVALQLKLENRSAGELLVEDAEHKFLIWYFENAKWVTANATLVTIISAVRNAERVDVKAVKKAA